MALHTSVVLSPFGSVIPSSSTHSRHSSTSSRSTTPDSIFSDNTRLSVTPYRNPSHRPDAELAALETPIRPRHRTRRTREKPRFTQGVAAYPLTFPDPRDIYTYHQDSSHIIDLLDREHRRLAALPPAVFSDINRHAFPLDPDGEKRVGYLIKKWRDRIDAKQEKLFAYEAFPVVHQDLYAHSLRHCSMILLEKLARQSRANRDRRALPVPAAAAEGGRLGFTQEQQTTYDRIVKWKGELPLNMEQYAQWHAAWGTMQVEKRAGRTALGARRTSSSSTITTGATAIEGAKPAGTAKATGPVKRKRSDLTINVAPIPEEHRLDAQAEAGTPVTGDSSSDRRPEKKRRNHQKSQGEDEANGTITPGGASAYFTNQQKHASTPPTAPITKSTPGAQSARQRHGANPAKSTSRSRTRTADTVAPVNAQAAGTPTRLGFAVSKRSMTSSCSSADGMDKPSPLESPAVSGVVRRGLVSAGSLDEQFLELERPAVVKDVTGSGARGDMGMCLPSAASLDDELMRLVNGSSPVPSAPEERFVTAPSTLAIPQASFNETVITTSAAAIEIAGIRVDAVTDGAPDKDKYGADFWDAAKQRKTARLERARRRSTQRKETSDEESEEGSKASRLNSAKSVEREDELDVGNSREEQNVRFPLVVTGRANDPRSSHRSRSPNT